MKVGYAESLDEVGGEYFRQPLSKCYGSVKIALYSEKAIRRTINISDGPAKRLFISTMDLRYAITAKSFVASVVVSVFHGIHRIL